MKTETITRQPQAQQQEREQEITPNMALSGCAEETIKGIIGTTCFASTYTCLGSGLPAIPQVLLPATEAGCLVGASFGLFKMAIGNKVSNCLDAEPMYRQ